MDGRSFVMGSVFLGVSMMVSAYFLSSKQNADDVIINAQTKQAPFTLKNAVDAQELKKNSKEEMVTTNTINLSNIQENQISQSELEAFVRSNDTLDQLDFDVLTNSQIIKNVPNVELDPNSTWGQWQQEITAWSDKEFGAIQDKRVKFLKEAMLQPVGLITVRSSVDLDTAQKEANLLGLSGNIAQLYIAFATGEKPNFENIEAIVMKFGDKKIGYGAVQRIKNSALSGNRALIIPVVALDNELGTTIDYGTR